MSKSVPKTEFEELIQSAAGRGVRCEEVIPPCSWQRCEVWCLPGQAGHPVSAPGTVQKSQYRELMNYFLMLLSIRAGKEPSRSCKFYNHGEGIY